MGDTDSELPDGSVWDVDTAEYGDDVDGDRGDRVDMSHSRCALGADCLVADPFHGSDECFDAEWVGRYEHELGGEG